MQTIIKKQISQGGGSLKIILQNGVIFRLPTNSTFYSKYKLGDTITDLDISKLASESTKYLLYQYALRQVAISPKNKFVLKQKLTQKLPPGSAPSLISEVVEALEAKSLLNEEDFAAYLLSRHQNKSAFFQKRILQQRGVNQDIISKLTNHTDNKQQIKLITNLTNKYHLRYQKLPKFQQNQKILNLLYQKGFPLALAKPIVDQSLKNS